MIRGEERVSRLFTKMHSEAMTRAARFAPVLLIAAAGVACQAQSELLRRLDAGAGSAGMAGAHGGSGGTRADAGAGGRGGVGTATGGAGVGGGGGSVGADGGFGGMLGST